MTNFRKQFETLNSRGDGLSALREAAYNRIEHSELIPSKMEEWRFTPGDKFSPDYYNTISSGEIDLDEHRTPSDSIPETISILVRSGQIDKKSLKNAGLPEGVTLRSLDESLASDPKLANKLADRTDLPGQKGLQDLSLAFLAGGIHLRVDKNTAVDKPIHFLFDSYFEGQPSLCSTFLLVEVEKNSKISVIEEYNSRSSTEKWINGDTAIFVGENSTLNHLVMNNENDESIQSSRLTVSISANGSYNGHNFNFGGKVLRQDSHIALEGEGGSSIYNTLSLLDEKKHYGQYTWQSHGAPHTTSSQTVKMILRDSATGVFNGRVMVKPEGQKTDAHQTNRNLLMSPNALVHSNPQLEIDADDVKCSHGSTTGELDEDTIFYLQSRGIDLESARNLLVEGFARELVSSIPIEAVSDRILAGLNAWLNKEGDQ